ncbi:MAG TPA: histidine phosphatase family protein [Burkholderiales bacterium]|nr:histidine phosphatase family protein [Burkholderiales bacterium]
MELILWRHADAEEGTDDMARRLTRKGEKQAAAMAKWLRAHLPEDYTLLASPAARAQETAAALGTKVITEKTLAPGAAPAAIIKAAQKHEGLVIVVGHQPDLGRAAAQWVAGARADWSIRKGAIWWLSGAPPARIEAVVSPDML